MALFRRANNAPIAAIEVQRKTGDGDWAQFDGNWTAFELSVGGDTDSGQNFNFLPSTSSYAIWLPVPEGCNITNITALSSSIIPTSQQSCATQRGVGLYNHQPSVGYVGKDSKTYFDLVQDAEFGLGSDLDITSLFGENFTVAGVSGLDYISVYSTDSSAAITPQKRVPILGDASWNYFSPIVGLGFGNWTSRADWALSLMSNLATNLTIPSLSWGYTAGARYRDTDGYHGSLVLGGYDESRIEPNSTGTFKMQPDSTELLVNVQTVGLDLGDGSGETYPKNFEAVIDSTLPYLYLPSELCEWLRAKYSLKYTGDPSTGGTGLYGINATQTSKNILNTRSIKFALTQPGSTNLLTSIDFTYESFNAIASWSWNFPGSQPIFLMRNMTGDKAVLGRAFFQEAYVSANYENTTGTGKTFNVSRAVFPPPPKTQIVSIMGERPGGSGGGSKLSGGAIAGIVIGAIAALIIAGLLSWFCFFKKRRDRRREALKAQEKPVSDEKDPTSMEGYPSPLGTGSTWTGGPLSEIGESRPTRSRQLSELSSDSDQTRPMPMLDTLHELPGKSEMYEREPYIRSQAETGELEGSSPWQHPVSPGSPGSPGLTSSPGLPGSPDPTTSSIHVAPSPIQESTPVHVDESRRL